MNLTLPMFCEMNGFWLFRLLVENPFEDYYIGLHLQNDLCYGYC